MQIQVNAGSIENSPAIAEHTHVVLETALKHVSKRITRVEVHLSDLNADKKGKDKRVLMEARPAGHKPLAVEGHGTDLYQVIKDVANKLQRAVMHRLNKQQHKRLQSA